jgi:hypothetical protein
MSQNEPRQTDQRQRLDPEHQHDDSTQPEEVMQQEEHHPDIMQFEREFGAHNRDRKSGWNASDEHAHSLNDEEEGENA